jgi:branched-chain amino acid transport system substrate-binding protein
MRMAALMTVLKPDISDIKSVYLIGQDYSFGQAVLREARRQLGCAAARHPTSWVTSCIQWAASRTSCPMLAKIKASGAQAVITGNWGNDLTLLVKAAKRWAMKASSTPSTAMRWALPAAIGDAGIGKVIAVADWLPNVPTRKESRRSTKRFDARFPKPVDDYVHMRMQLMVEALAQAIERAGTSEAAGRGTAAGECCTSRLAVRLARCAPPITSFSSSWWWG